MTCYFTDVPILDAGVARHAEAVRQCDGLVFVYSSIASSLPPAMKGWLDRVLVPGVSFVMEDGKLRGGLGHVRVLAGIAVHGESRATIRRHRDLGRRMLMRSLRSCAPKRLRTAWLALYEPELDDTKRFAGEVERTIGRLVR